MSLNTHSKFYFGFEVDDMHLNVDFNEGSGERTATLEIGKYTLDDFTVELARALNAAGTLAYTVTADRVSRLITIAASGTFSLLSATGSHLGTSVFELVGFTGANHTGSASYTSNNPVGQSYATQFILQSYLGAEDNQEATYGTVNQSASGKVEVVTFGNIQFVEANIKFVTNFDHGAGAPIRTNLNGVEDLRNLMRYLTTKGPLEFMPDESNPDQFNRIMLESTADDQKGLKFKLKELYGQGLPGYYETGVLKFRVLD